MKRKHSAGFGCFLLIVFIAAVGLFQLAGGLERMDYGEYPNAQASIAAFCQTHEVSMDDYPEKLVDLLERNPETEEFVLHYPLDRADPMPIDLSDVDAEAGVPLFLQWDRRWGWMEYGGSPAALTGCGPLCLSMAAFYLTGDEAYSPDKMLEFASDNGYYSPGNGSKWTLISEGAEDLGFDVTEIPLVKSRILDHLEAGNPIICAMGAGDFTSSGHFIVLVGEEDGLIRVNDPNSRRNSDKLWKFEDIEDQFRNLWVIRK